MLIYNQTTNYFSKNNKKIIIMGQKETVTLTVNTVNSVLQYIGSKPYIEVAQLINQIQTEVQQFNKQEDGNDNQK